MQHLGVTLIREAEEIAVEEGRVCYRNFRGQLRSISTEQVIVARGATGDTSLAEEFSAAGLTVHTIGDCRGVGYIEGAMESAAELAVKL